MRPEPPNVPDGERPGFDGRETMQIPRLPQAPSPSSGGDGGGSRQGGPVAPAAILLALGAVFVVLFVGARQMMEGSVSPTPAPFENRATATPRAAGSPGAAAGLPLPPGSPVASGSPGLGLTQPAPRLAGAPSPEADSSPAAAAPGSAAPPAPAPVSAAPPAPAPSPGNDVVVAPTSEPVLQSGPPRPDPAQVPLFVGFIQPVNGDRVSARPDIKGVRRGLQGPDEHVWLLIHPQGPTDLWWTHQREIIADRDGGWEIADLEIGGPAGLQHELVIGVVDADGHQRIVDQVVKRPGQPFNGLPPGFRTLTKITVVKAG
ncbi:MAG: hypothetical protein U0893_22335 [Chloroflexota bacterium]